MVCGCVGKALTLPLVDETWGGAARPGGGYNKKPAKAVAASCASSSRARYFRIQANCNPISEKLQGNSARCYKNSVVCDFCNMARDAVICARIALATACNEMPDTRP